MNILLNDGKLPGSRTISKRSVPGQPCYDSRRDAGVVLIDQDYQKAEEREECTEAEAGR